MPVRQSHLVACVISLAIAACGSASTPSWDVAPRTLGPLPARFVPDAGGPSGTEDDHFCLVRLHDPATGTRLRLVRSAVHEGRALGDYAVDPGTSYGLGVDELLRLDCGTGRALGAVPAVA